MGSTGSTIVADFSWLPEEIISHVISLTTPRDACVASTVCRDFQSAADSDATWHRLLPSDCASFLSQVAHPVEHASIKELYLHLCDHPLLIDGGLMSFALEKSTGAKIFMISARRLSIGWRNDPHCWDWIALPDSRFSECAEVQRIWWLHIRGKLNSEILTPNTPYAAYLVFKLREDAHTGNSSLGTEIRVAGNVVCRHSVCIDPHSGNHVCIENVIHPSVREDGWLEAKLGAFVSREGIDEEVAMSFSQTNDYHPTSGLIVQGIEVRPIIGMAKNGKIC